MEESIGGGSRAAVQDMNEFLRAACVQHDCLYYLGQKGFARSRFEIFKPDGVHFIFLRCSQPPVACVPSATGGVGIDGGVDVRDVVPLNVISAVGGGPRGVGGVGQGVLSSLGLRSVGHGGCRY